MNKDERIPELIKLFQRVQSVIGAALQELEEINQAPKPQRRTGLKDKRAEAFVTNYAKGTWRKPKGI